MLREVSKVLGTRDIIEEYVACWFFLVQEGWFVSLWAAEEKWVGGIPMPNFTTNFVIKKEGEIFDLCLRFLFDMLCL